MAGKLVPRDQKTTRYLDHLPGSPKDYTYKRKVDDVICQPKCVHPRTQTPRAFWSAGERLERLWDNDI